MADKIIVSAATLRAMVEKMYFSTFRCQIYFIYFRKYLEYNFFEVAYFKYFICRHIWKKTLF